MSKRTIVPARKVSGLVEVPGDKSISHRYALLAALANGRSEITGYAAAADCQSTLNCLERLGVGVERSSGASAARWPSLVRALMGYAVRAALSMPKIPARPCA